MRPRPEDPTDHPAHALYAAALLHSVASGTAGPLEEALSLSRSRIDGADATRIVSAALASQGLGPLAASLPDVHRLPPGFRALLGRALEEGRAAATARLADLSRTVTELRAGGFEAVLFGGLAAALTAYREAALRPARTVRLLLVQAGDRSRARRTIPALASVSLHSRLAYRHAAGTVDLTDRILDEPVVRTVSGVKVLVASPSAQAAGLLHAAAADFARDGFPGVAAIDLRLIALERGPLSFDGSVTSPGAASSLIHAVDAIERFCPGTFDPALVARLASSISPERRERGRRIPPLFSTRGAGSRRLPVALVEGRLARLLVLLRPPGRVG